MEDEAVMARQPRGCKHTHDDEARAHDWERDDHQHLRSWPETCMLQVLARAGGTGEGWCCGCMSIGENDREIRRELTQGERVF